MSWMALHFDKPLVTTDAVLQRVVDLLEADEVITPGQATKYRRGTNDILLRKDLAGTTCTDNVSLTE